MAVEDLDISQITPEQLTPEFINKTPDEILSAIDVPTLTKAAVNLSRKGNLDESHRLFNILETMENELYKSLFSEEGGLHKKMLYYINVSLLAAKTEIYDKDFDGARESYHRAIKYAELIQLGPEKYTAILEEFINFLKTYNLEDPDAEIIEEKLQKAKDSLMLKN